MKQIIRFIAIVVLSAVMAFAAAVGVLLLTKSEAAFISTAIFGGLFIALIMGAFDERENTRYESIKHRMGIKKAA